MKLLLATSLLLSFGTSASSAEFGGRVQRSLRALESASDSTTQDEVVLVLDLSLAKTAAIFDESSSQATAVPSGSKSSKKAKAKSSKNAKTEEPPSNAELAARIDLLAVHIDGLEDQVESLEDQVENLEDRLTTPYYQRIATFPICKQIDATCNTDVETVADMVVVTDDGMTLVYTDFAQENLGFVDITDPSNPKALGTFALPAEPTSVAVMHDYALAAINTSTDFVNPSGMLVVLDISDVQNPVEIAQHDIGGQPESIAVSPNEKKAVITIENGREGELGDGILPQYPPGHVAIVHMDNPDPAKWYISTVSLTGGDFLFPSDPEPDHVSINKDGIAVITIQENNGIVLIDLATEEVLTSIHAGSVSLMGIDTAEDGVIAQINSLDDVVHEPDGVVWINEFYFATANEGALNGGSRTFSIYRWQPGFGSSPGTVKQVYNDAGAMEDLITSFGHYPEDRSANKGNEPETVAYDNEHKLLFVLSEQSNTIMVYDVANPESPKFHQVLVASARPEGGLYVKKRNIFVAASKEDARGDKLRASLGIFSMAYTEPTYPTIKSILPRQGSAPIAWGALSGLSPCLDEESPYIYSIEDSFYKKSRYFVIDLSMNPPTIVKAVRIKDSKGIFASYPVVDAKNATSNDFDSNDLKAMINDDDTVNIDSEGIAAYKFATGLTGFWIAHEGRGTIDDSKRPVESHNLLLFIDGDGVIHKVIGLPEEVNQIQIRFGFEGVTTMGDMLVVAFQRAWKGETHARIGCYDIALGTWTFLNYPLAPPESQNGGWVGLGDLTHVGDGEFLVVERDNQGGPDAAVKRLYQFSLKGLKDGDEISKVLFKDILPTISAEIGGMALEKVEGVAVSSGNVWIVTDNDGVDGSSGETQLINIGGFGSGVLR